MSSGRFVRGWRADLQERILDAAVFSTGVVVEVDGHHQSARIWSVHSWAGQMRKLEADRAKECIEPPDLQL